MNSSAHICLKGQPQPHTGQISDQTTWWLFQDLPTPVENMLSSPTPEAPQEGASPVPSPSQPTRRLIRLSSPERQRLSSLNLTPDPEMEPPPKPPRSFVGWGVAVQTPQGKCSAQMC